MPEYFIKSKNSANRFSPMKLRKQLASKRSTSKPSASKPSARRDKHPESLYRVDRSSSPSSPSSSPSSSDEMPRPMEEWTALAEPSFSDIMEEAKRQHVLEEAKRQHYGKKKVVFHYSLYKGDGYKRTGLEKPFAATIAAQKELVEMVRDMISSMRMYTVDIEKQMTKLFVATTVDKDSIVDLDAQCDCI